MARLAWYWHRLRAMSASEMAAHFQKRIRQRQDTEHLPNFFVADLSSPGAFPKLPDRTQANEQLRLRWSSASKQILSGRWKAFNHFDLQVDDPPKWHKDYLAGIDTPSSKIAFRLNHRELPNGADIKLIWELSRWYELVRLAQAAYLADDQQAADTCIRWLHDWQKHNPPFQGWNWTSALESGMRLIQFTWIDALLAGSSTKLKDQLVELRKSILPAHVWFTWRYKSFGSSANNHLLGELVGLILAQTRWPELEQYSTTLDNLQKRFEAE
ncbi:MAG: hypothetical protein ACK4UN_11495, partial [Limisphaerales bacterium]